MRGWLRRSELFHWQQISKFPNIWRFPAFSVPLPTREVTNSIREPATWEPSGRNKKC
jgi:hypothetical protein